MLLKLIKHTELSSPDKLCPLKTTEEKKKPFKVRCLIQLATQAWENQSEASCDILRKQTTSFFFFLSVCLSLSHRQSLNKTDQKNVKSWSHSSSLWVQRCCLRHNVITVKYPWNAACERLAHVAPTTSAVGTKPRLITSLSCTVCRRGKH